MLKHNGMVLGIDASNIRAGGGLTHLVELLTVAEPEEHGFSKVVVWGGDETLRRLPERLWLIKDNLPELNQGLVRRACWQRFSLSRMAYAAGCSMLYIPGGSYACNFRPVVTMSQNLLPFEWRELRRYGWTLNTLKFLLLRCIQCHSFRRADGVIFLTEYAKRVVLKATGRMFGKTVIIPHGLNPRFKIEPIPTHLGRTYTEANPCRALYVSIVDQYKHQWHVAEAVNLLRAEGLPLVLDLVGPAYPPALARLQKVIERLDPEGRWVHYHGPVAYESLNSIYEHADIGVFASSCESISIILLETMAAGLPVACSNRGPMPEILGDAGLYFDPENPADIAGALKKYIFSPNLRQAKAQAGFEKAKKYTWRECADRTFSFLADVVRGGRS